MRTIIITYCLLVSLFQEAHAYLDPGTGSMLISAIVGIIATLLFAIKTLYYKFSAYVLSRMGIKLEKNTEKIVFYSEGPAYWKTFKPLLAQLEQRNIHAVYLTSSQDDPGLKYPFEFIRSRYIGTGNKAYSYLNMLEADLCVLTTPGLDVLQIRRSKGVKHYAHVVHAVTDISLYKLFSFDYYDSIYCSGPHQINTLRQLEKKRGTQKKTLIKAGCLYLDELANKLKEAQQTAQKTEHTPSLITIVIAPTWGPNGLLSRFGMALFIPLLEHNYRLIIRPHPQSFISERDLITKLQEELSHYKNISWDNNPEGFNALNDSNIMISDLSGVCFDYAFIFEKPVITVQFCVERLGTDGAYLPTPPWELTALNTIGRQILPEQLSQLPEIIASLLDDSTKKQQIHALRDASLYAFGNTAEIVADHLLLQLEQLTPQKNF